MKFGVSNRKANTGTIPTKLGIGRLRIGQALKNLDIFGEPLPTLNIEGKSHIYSLLGGICTLVTIFVVMIFAAVKFEQLITRHNPIMSSYERDLPLGEVMNLSERKFRIAFAVEDYQYPYKLKNDPNYVKWIFRLFGKKDNKIYDKILSHHLCTEEEYAEFHTIQT